MFGFGKFSSLLVVLDFSPIGVALKGSNAIKAVADVPDVVPGRVPEGSGKVPEGSCLLG